jgi:FtsZ-binding cell division protein ZapB
MLFQQIIKDILNNIIYIKMTSTTLQMDTIALKEQMANLRAKLREKKKETADLKKEYKVWKENHDRWAFNFINGYECGDEEHCDSFEELVVSNEFENNGYLLDWELIFNELKFKDIEFFNKFIQWDKGMFKIPSKNRKCSICLDYYSNSTCIKKFKNCKHTCCTTCYPQIHLQRDGFKCCGECRTSEKPVPVI